MTLWAYARAVALGFVVALCAEADNLAVVRHSTISDNAQHGIDVGVQHCDTGGRAILVGSRVTANGFGCVGPTECADLTTCGRNNATPRVRNESSCGRSYVRGSGLPGMSWGICAQD